jgi:hypothetical protein
MKLHANAALSWSGRRRYREQSRGTLAASSPNRPFSGYLVTGRCHKSPLTPGLRGVPYG